MITFKDFLNEKAMNPSEFKKTEARQKDTMLIGFEFECVVPKGSRLYPSEPPKSEAAFQLVRDIKGFGELRDLFDVSSNDTKSIRKDFGIWAEENGDGSGEDLDFYSSSDFMEFVKSVHKNMAELIKEFDLEPRFGWAGYAPNPSVYTEEPQQADDPLQDEAFQNIQKDLPLAIGYPVTIPSSRSDRDPLMGRGRWLITQDHSIEGSSEMDIGVEIISPPTPLARGIKDLENMFKWMEKNGIETNISTGFHINLSTPNIKDIDLVKLVLFTGEKHVLKAFDRISNSYTNPQIRSIISNVTGRGTLPSEASEMIGLAKASLSANKHSAIHTEKLKQGYLEFRMAGNANYHKDFKKMKDTLLRFAAAIEIASDPKAERNEYLKKLSTLFSKVKDEEGTDLYDELPITRILQRGSQEQDAKILDQYLANAKAGKKLSNLAIEKRQEWAEHTFLKAIFRALLELGIKVLSDRQRAEFRLIMKRLEIPLDDLKGPSDPWKIDVLKRLGILK